MFNTFVRGFVGDLRAVFPSGDPEIMCIVAALELLRVNARIVIAPFAKHLLTRTALVRALLQEDLEAIKRIDFRQIIKSSEFSYKLLRKFTLAVSAHEHDDVLRKKMFNWFKIMIYYALEDQGGDASPEEKIERLCASGASASGAAASASARASAVVAPPSTVATTATPATTPPATTTRG